VGYLGTSCRRSPDQASSQDVKGVDSVRGAVFTERGEGGEDGAGLSEKTPAEKISIRGNTVISRGRIN